MKLFRFIKLNNIHEKSGAGEEGTNELVNQYKKETPGEVDEGQMKSLSIDLKDLDDKEFKSKYGKTKEIPLSDGLVSFLRIFLFRTPSTKILLINDSGLYFFKKAEK